MFHSTQIPYLLWKTNNLIFWPSKIWMRKLHQNGLSFDEKSDAIPILTAYLFHELHCVEGPWMIYRQGIHKCTNIQICNIIKFNYFDLGKVHNYFLLNY